jgi:hypothetical protein
VSPRQSPARHTPSKQPSSPRSSSKQPASPRREGVLFPHERVALINTTKPKGYGYPINSSEKRFQSPQKALNRDSVPGPGYYEIDGIHEMLSPSSPRRR